MPPRVRTLSSLGPVRAILYERAVAENGSEGAGDDHEFAHAGAFWEPATASTAARTDG
jgi:hypothetical protein